MTMPKPFRPPSTIHYDGRQRSKTPSPPTSTTTAVTKLRHPPPEVSMPMSSIVNKHGAIGTPPKGAISSCSKPTSNNTNNNNNNSDGRMVVALRWLTAIQEATRCLRDRPMTTLTDNGTLPAAIEHALDYLMALENLLTPLETQWDQGPNSDPPQFVPYQAKKKSNDNNKNNKKGKKNRNNNNKTLGADQSPTSVVQTWKPQPQKQQQQDGSGGGWTTVVQNKKHRGRSVNNNNNLGGNRFAHLFDDDDSSDEETLEEDLSLPNSKDDGTGDDVITGRTILSSCGSRCSTTGSLVLLQEQDNVTAVSSRSDVDDLQEAGDVPTLNRIAHFPTGTVMSMRRLMIRIVTAQSELFAYQASGYRRCQQWSLAAKNCHASLCKIHQGLILADSEISRCFATSFECNGNNGIQLQAQLQPLMEDAAIVEVAVKSLTNERDSFVQKALQAKHQLIRKLEAMYIGRYQARMRLGDDWYKSRPKPKTNKQQSQQYNQSHSMRRDEKEDELVEIQMALDNLCQWDTTTLLASADHLKLRLNAVGYNGGAAAGVIVSPPTRNNQLRPKDITGRVDLNLYPDPTLYGWSFTGSYVESQGGRRIEFFEKQNMLLDWHYETAQLELKWKCVKHVKISTTVFWSDGPLHSLDYMELIKSFKPWEVAKKFNNNNNTLGANSNYKN